MKTIVLDVPDEVIHELQNIDLLEIIKIGLAFYKTKISIESKSSLLSIHNPEVDKKKWTQELLKISTWTEKEIKEIEKSRNYINQWKPRQFV